MELKPGDIVRLKSGGFPITITEVNEDTAECVWMGEEGDFFRETLPIVALEPAETDDSDDEEEDEEDADEEDDEEEGDEDEAK
jgi:uncharacterized protein YodC (DUF2158 family)